MSDDYSLITEHLPVPTSEFTLLKTCENYRIKKKYNIKEDHKAFHQFCLDIPRQDVYLVSDNDTPILTTSISEVTDYINSNHCLRADKWLVYFFLTQTALSIPMLLLDKILKNLNNNLVISESSPSRRTIIYINSDTISIRKLLQAISETENREFKRVLNFELCMEVDLLTCETTVYISSDKICLLT